MASKKAVAFALAMLGESFPTREITERTAPMWLEVFDEIEDKLLTRAAIEICRNPDQKFFPTTGEVFGVIAALRPKLEAPDADALLLKIAKLGDYKPNVGWLYPRIAEVRAALGDEVAAAYGAAGGSNCFSDNQTTREIARKHFATELGTQIRHKGSLLLGMKTMTPLLEGGSQ